MTPDDERFLRRAIELAAQARAAGEAPFPYRLRVVVNRCGDGVLGPGETCDDGGTSGGDGCDASCELE